MVETVRAVWPQGKPLFVRVSAIDGPPEGVGLEDTVAFARELKRLGVDVVTCSSGGVAPTPPPVSGPGYQVPYAETVRRDAGVMTLAVGLITEPHQAEAILQEGRADLVAMARQALADPSWPVRAHKALLPDSSDYEAWTGQTAFWLTLREKGMQRLGIKDRDR